MKLREAHELLPLPALYITDVLLISLSDLLIGYIDIAISIPSLPTFLLRLYFESISSIRRQKALKQTDR
jgi:hypothetical protein